MAAIIQIDQVGLSAGVAGKSRSDGLRTGALVTVSSVGVGTTHTLEFEWIPEGDTTTATSFTPVGATQWTFSPTANVAETWRLKLTVDGEVTRRLFSVRTEGAGLRIPALNEYASPLATLLTGLGLVDESEQNEDLPGAFVAGNYGGAFEALRGLFLKVEELYAPAPAHIYVATSGDDANDGLTITTPIASISRLWELIPRGPLSSVVHVHFASGTYTFAQPPVIEFDPSGGLLLHGDGAGQIGDDGFTELYAGTITSAGTSSVGHATITDSTASWVVDELVGKTLTMAGPLGAQYRTIIENTTTTITYTYNEFTGSLIAGEAYRVLEPAVIWDSGPATKAMLIPSPLGVINLRFQGVGTENVRWRVDKETTVFGVETSAADFSGFVTPNQGVTFSAGSHTSNISKFGIEQYMVGLFPDGIFGFRGWGISAWDAAVSLAYIPIDQAFRFVGTGCGAVFLGTQGGAAWNVIGGRLDGCVLFGAHDLRLDGTIMTVRTSGFQIRAGGRVSQNFGKVCEFRLAASSSSVIVCGQLYTREPGMLFTGTSGNFSIREGSVVSGEGMLTFEFGSADITVSDSILECQGSATLRVLTAENSRCTFGRPSGSTVTLTGALRVLENSTMRFQANLVGITALVQDASALVLSGASHTLNSPNNSLVADRGGTVTQLSGTLSVTATSGSAIIAEKNSRMALLGGASTVTSATSQGVIARSGSSVWFNSSPTGISGQAGQEIRVGVESAQNIAGLTGVSAGAFITDTPAAASVGTGGASVIGRAG